LFDGVCAIIEPIMQENSPDSLPPTETKNKTFVLVSAILLLAIAVIIAVFFNKNQANQANQDVKQQLEQPEPTTTEPTTVIWEGEVTTDAQQSEVEGTLLFSDLIAQKEGSYHCQIDNEDGYYVYYLDDQRMAVEVKTPTVHSKTIVTEDFTYTWNVAEKVGTKVANEEEILAGNPDQEAEAVGEEMLAETPEENLLPVEDNEAFDPANFVCEPWVVEESVFTPPSDVIFQDPSQFQEQTTNVVQ